MSKYELGQVNMAKEIIAWVSCEHEHHGTLDEEWFNTIIMEVPDGDNDPPYPGCQDGGYPYVNSLSLERHLLHRIRVLSVRANQKAGEE